MTGKNTILLISDNKYLSEELENKLIFLRHDDTILVSNYEKALNNLEFSRADIVLIHENTSARLTIELIKKLRTNKNLCIILLANSNNSELILASETANDVSR